MMALCICAVHAPGYGSDILILATCNMCHVSFLIHSFGENSVSHEGVMTVLTVIRTMSNLKELM